jgi:hypothetical protein
MYILYVVKKLFPTNTRLGETVLTFTQKIIRSLGISCAALAAFAAPSANATVVTSTSGLTTTYTENFNGGSSFVGGWFNAPLSSDDYLWLTALAPTSSYTFSSSRPLSQLSLSFWYSVPGNNSGQVEFASSGIVSLGDTPGSALQFLLNNPGSSSGGIGGGFDNSFYGSVFNLGAGMYTITLSTAGHLLDGLKVDDVTITATAVPEPGTLAIMGLGLAGVGYLRRRPGKKSKGSQAFA